MSQGYTAIFLTPSADVLPIPANWTTDYTSDSFTAKIKYVDNEPDFTVFDHEPSPEEITAACLAVHAEGFNAELRQIGENWRLRVRYPVSYTTETRGSIAHIYKLTDSKIPAGWDHAVCFWWVQSTAANLKTLHTHIYTTLGYGPIAGALAALDPTNPTKFLDKAVQTATSLTNAQQLARVTAMRDRLVQLGFAATAMSAIVSQPAGKTEDDLIRALVSDLGFTTDQLFKTMIRLD